MKTIYSLRDSLGRELWWTTGRNPAIALAADLNESGVGALVTDKGKCGYDYKRTDPRCLTRDTLPVSVYRCSVLAVKTPAEPERPLSERRAADRETMATKLIEAAVKAGAAGVRDNSQRNDRRIDVRIDVPGGATIQVDFDGRSGQPDVFVQTWNLTRPAYDAGVRLRDWEGRATAKRNTVARGFDQLVSMLVVDITGFVTGDGYWR